MVLHKYLYRVSQKKCPGVCFLLSLKNGDRCMFLNKFTINTSYLDMLSSNFSSKYAFIKEICNFENGPLKMALHKLCIWHIGNLESPILFLFHFIATLVDPK